MTDGIERTDAKRRVVDATLKTVQPNQREYAVLQRDLSKLQTISSLQEKLNIVEMEVIGINGMVNDDDPEMRRLVESELASLAAQKMIAENELLDKLICSDENDDKESMLEVRPGTGGEEAGLFADEIFTMYRKLCLVRGWTFEVFSERRSDKGLREGIAAIRNNGTYGILRFETGVHRVQRVPQSEGAGRVHTSTVSVFVTPEVQEDELEFKESDLRIDLYSASGPGGQHVNKTLSAVRITHLPTNLVVAIQDERSQHMNKAKAMRLLRSRVADYIELKKEAERSKERQTSMPKGDRSERIRTYNYARDQVTDHRIPASVFGIQNFLDGTSDIETSFTNPLRLKGVMSQLEVKYN